MAEHRNSSNRAVRRIVREVKEFEADDNPTYAAAPLDDDLFEWHFTIRGPRDSEFEGGVYHGRIILPTDYPMKPPDIVILTPNGRFKVGEKICLTISGHHPEHWQPAWSIRTALLAIISFLPTPGNGALGAIDQPEDVRRELARKSRTWSCTRCGSNNATALPEEEEEEVAATPEAGDEAPAPEGGGDNFSPEEGNDGLRKRTTIPLERESQERVGETEAPVGEQRQPEPEPQPLQQQLRGAAVQGGMGQGVPLGAPLPPGVAMGMGQMAPGDAPRWGVPGMPVVPPRVNAARAAYQGMGGADLMQQQQQLQAMMMQQQRVGGPVRRRRVFMRARVRIPLGSFDLLISILVVFIAALLLRKFYFVPSMP